MSIMNLEQTGSLRRVMYKDVAMTMTPFIRLLDELIDEKATKNCEGWFLSLHDLTRNEIRKLNDYGYGDLQYAIDSRCQDSFEYWRDNRGFDE